MTRTDRALLWLGSRYFVLGALGLVSSLTSLMLVSLLLGSSAPPWAYPFLQICGFDPVKGTAPFGRVLLLVFQGYLTVAVLVFFLWADFQQLWRSLPSKVLVATALLSPAVVFSFGIGAGRVELATPYGQPLVREGSPAPDFRLVDSSGVTVRMSDFRGKVVLVTFFYANCAEACPPLLARLRDTMARWQGTATVVALAITLDPERDTAEALAQYAAKLGVNGGSLRLLTGSREQVARAWNSYGVEPRPLPGGVVGHDVRIILVDRQGQIAYTFYGLDYPERWLNNALELLVAEGR